MLTVPMSLSGCLPAMDPRTRSIFRYHCGSAGSLLPLLPHPLHSVKKPWPYVSQDAPFLTRASHLPYLRAVISLPVSPLSPRILCSSHPAFFLLTHKVTAVYVPWDSDAPILWAMLSPPSGLVIKCHLQTSASTHNGVADRSYPPARDRHTKAGSIFEKMVSRMRASDSEGL